MPSPSKYTVANVDEVLESIDELIITDKDLRRLISEVTGLIHPLALKQFIKSMKELDYITVSNIEGIETGEWMIRDRRDL